jgi:hypothetical protein
MYEALEQGAIAHPLYTRFMKRIGTSIAEATMRPNPTCLQGAKKLLAAESSGVDVRPIVRGVIRGAGERDLRPATLEAARRKVARLLVAAL